MQEGTSLNGFKFTHLPVLSKEVIESINNLPQAKLKKGEFHLLDLVGMEARFHQEGPAIGKVTDLSNAGNDLLEIELLEGRKVLIPFVKAIVPEVMLNEGWLKITPPPGLLEL